jgi:short-subunit dehydrogenase
MELNVFANPLSDAGGDTDHATAGGRHDPECQLGGLKKNFTMIGGYASTKYALNALSLTARQELAKDNIVVSVFHPKMTATEFGQLAWRKIFFERRAPPGMMVDTAEAVAGRIVEQIESGGAEAQM